MSLMQRDAGSVRLTVKGQELLGHAREVLKSAERFTAAAGRDSLANGQLRLGVTEMVVHSWARDFMRVLKGRYPNIAVELTVDLSANLEQELLERSIDLAFQSGPFGQPISGELDLGVFAMIWIASPQAGLHTLGEVRLEDLMQYPILTHARNTQPYREVAAHFSNRRNLTARLVPSSNLAACIHMTIEGFGIAAVPAAMVVDELQAGELVQINYAWTPRALQFSARYDADRTPQYVAAAAEIAAEVSHDFSVAFAASSGIGAISENNE